VSWSTPSGRSSGAEDLCSLAWQARHVTHNVSIDCCARWEAVLAFWLLLRMVHVAVLSAASYGLRFGVNFGQTAGLAVARV
jgi:hypothetical protein